MNGAPAPPLIECRGLSRHYPVFSGVFGREIGRVRAVDDLSLAISRGETYSLVGESGCGKSTTGRLLLRLEKPTTGSILVRGRDVTRLAGSELRFFRRLAQPVFQDPFASLNPRMTVGEIVEEGLLIQFPALSRAERRERAVDLLSLAGLPGDCLDRWPHEFSGGQRQRIGLARALSPNPEFIVADEAVSALDVSIQAQIINLLMDLQARLGLAYLFIAHDLAVVKHLSRRVGVMYLGHLVEEAETGALFSEPLHPYTRALISAIPNPDPRARRRPPPLAGEVPRADRPPSGCRFRTRCPVVLSRCGEADIPVFVPAPGRKVRCLRYETPPAPGFPERGASPPG
jgi:oligopeptide/dipeptide ABC transporter ATP-binding protein